MPLEQKVFDEKTTPYGLWHRPSSIRRFLAGRDVTAKRLTMIDVDGIYVEAKHPNDRTPVALVETQQVWDSPGKNHFKNTGILTELGKAANVPVLTVLYIVSEHPNPVPAYRAFPDIDEFFVKMVYPKVTTGWVKKTPEQYANFLVRLRDEHTRLKKNPHQLPLLEGGQPMSDSDLDSYLQMLGYRMFR